LAELDRVGCKKLALERVGFENRAFMLLTFTLSGVSMLGPGERGIVDELRGEMACFERSGVVVFCCEAKVGDAKRPTDWLRASSVAPPRLLPTEWFWHVSLEGC
jgi:hypothetical protein